jgi:hypothetical protein
MLKTLIGWTVLMTGLTTLAYALTPEAKPDERAAQIERGRYLVTAFGCQDCHTPWKLGASGMPEPDAARAFSGHPADLVLPPAPTLPPGPWVSTVAATMTAWSGPWGTSYTANLTPDDETGIGKWTEENFVDTIRTGRHLGRGRHILPPMPYAPLSNLTVEDLRSMFHYLRSLPPIRNRVPEPLPPADVHAMPAGEKH